MQEVGLTAVAGRHAEWLSVRLKAVAGNIANVNTPGYRARDVQPFSDVLQNRTMGLTRTDLRHMDVAGNRLEAAIMKPEATGETTHSGNNVSLENELRKSGEISQAMSLNTAVSKAFRNMLMTVIR